MALEAGTRLGHYEVVSSLGAGGMGEVYRAKDTKLGREVAIKLLLEEVSADPERLARFEREARVLASLNHPNIATLHGFEKEGDTSFLVMELVEGETLADRIKRGAIPVDEALPLFIQIAEGLEAAHTKGVIHRDLKPANIKLGNDEEVKILDFGLAKALVDEADAADDPAMSQSPTLTLAATRRGEILGTAAYMSPEQASGKVVDRRTDVWALGVCLYEALTGRRVFQGEGAPETLAKVLESAPDFAVLPPATPVALRRLLRRCLEKDKRQRIQHVGDVRIELGEALANPEAEGEGQGTEPPRRAPPVAFLLVAMASAAVSALAVWIFVSPRGGAAPDATRLSINLAAGQYLVEPHSQEPGRYPPIAASPDGRHLVYAATNAAGTPQLYLRALGGFEVRELPGTENAELPFFSPGGDWVGFWANDSVYKVPTGGGAPIKLADVRLGARGACWTLDDTLILGGVNRGLLRLGADGGTPEEIISTNVARGEEYHAWPSLLPNQEHLLFTAVTAESSNLAWLSLTSADWDLIEGTQDATQAQYLDSGHLVFLRKGAVYAVPFDLKELSLSGEPKLVLDGVLTKSLAGHQIAYFAVARGGTLMYVPGGPWSPRNKIVSVDRDGNASPLVAETGVFGYGVSISPEGTRLAVTNGVTGNGKIWVHDLTRGTRTRLSSEETSDIFPVWGADGRKVFFASYKSGSFNLYETPADGSGPHVPLLTVPFGQNPTSVSRDGQHLAFLERNLESGHDIHLLSLHDDPKAAPFRATPASERDPAISPDGRYLAYSSNDSGRYEVYVESMAGDEGRTTVSSEGGRWPHWSHAGDELFYLSGSTMMAVDVEIEPTFQPGSPKPLFEGTYDEWYDVAPDGSFVMLTRQLAKLAEIQVVLNWSEELKRIVPTN